MEWDLFPLPSSWKLHKTSAISIPKEIREWRFRLETVEAKGLRIKFVFDVDVLARSKI